MSLGQEFRTGEKAPVSGVYRFVRHIDSPPSCNPTSAENEIPLSKGETFPPHRSCGKGAIWSLVRLA